MRARRSLLHVPEKSGVDAADCVPLLPDPITGVKDIAVLRGHEESVRSAAFSPDGKRIVTASVDRTARIWDAATAKEIAVLRHDAPAYSAAFSPDGKRIVTASEDKTARIWDAATAEEIAVLRGHPNSAAPSNTAATSSMKRRLSSSSRVRVPARPTRSPTASPT